MCFLCLLQWMWNIVCQHNSFGPTLNMKRIISLWLWIHKRINSLLFNVFFVVFLISLWPTFMNIFFFPHKYCIWNAGSHKEVAILTLLSQPRLYPFISLFFVQNITHTSTTTSYFQPGRQCQLSQVSCLQGSVGKVVTFFYKSPTAAHLTKTD